MYHPRTWAVCLLAVAAIPAAGQTPPTPYLGANFTSITRNQTTALSGISFEPPDTMGAVGLNHYVQFNNGSFTVFTKAGTQVQQQTDGAFWTAAGVGINTADLSDPRILFDRAAQRWVAVEISTNEATNNRVLIARSDTADPSGSWRAVALTTTHNRFADYPTLGMTAEGVAVGTINFSPAGTVSLYTLPKTSLYTAAGVTPTLADLTRFENRTQNNAGFLLQPAVNYSPTGNGTMAVVSPSNVSFSQLDRTTITGVGAAGATYSNKTTVPITTYAFAPNAQQPGSATTLDTIDDRFYTNVIHQGNLLYMANVVNSGASRAAVRFTVVNATTNAVVFQTTLSEASADYFYPALAVNPAGDVVIGMNLTRTAGNVNGTLSVSPAALVGSTSDFTNWTFNTPTVLFTGPGTYTGTRWGDYSATTLDPADPGVFWTTQETTGAAGSTANWATRVTEVIPAKAGEFRWQTSTTGTHAFGTAANWFNGAAPGLADHAIFSRWSPNSYTANLSAASFTLDRLSVRQTGTGVVTFLADSRNTTLTNPALGTPSLAISEFQGTADVRFNFGTLNTVNTVIGGELGGIGTLRIGVGNLWTNTGDVFLGGTATAAGGTGRLFIEDSAFGGAGRGQINGTLRTWTTGSSVTVGSGNATAASPTQLSVGRLVSEPGTAPTVTVAVNSRLTVTGSGDSPFTGSIVGAGAVVKEGTGALTLGASGVASTYTGGTTVTAGTFRPGAANVLPNAGTVALNGGTLSTGAGAGVSDTLGTLDLDASSAIALGTGPHVLQFSGIAASPTGTLTVTGWTGTGGGGSGGRLVFVLPSADAAAATTEFAAFLSGVVFDGRPGGEGLLFLGTGTPNVYELVPAPEPGLLLVPVAGVWLLRRRATRTGRGV